MDWWAKEKSPKPTVEMVSTVKYKEVSSDMWPPPGTR